ncbi:MAG: cyclopropane fatty-acyl-phospholipid synthase-like methyltransferase [Candidatus Woesearchaeota archaeon]|jgi:cyclopropane fatty-acyl-phospholipid synthase-like methyltransferase
MHIGDGFLGKYIFPGAWFPTIRTTEQSMNRHFGFVERKELPKGSYPKTLQCWYKDFCKNETKVKALIDKSGKCKDPEFAARIFKHYLVFAESVMVEEHRMCNFLLKKPKK